VFGHVGVYGRQRVIQEVDVSVAVQGSGQTDPLSLPTGEVDALRGRDTSMYFQRYNVYKKEEEEEEAKAGV